MLILIKPFKLLAVRESSTMRSLVSKAVSSRMINKIFNYYSSPLNVFLNNE